MPIDYDDMMQSGAPAAQAEALAALIKEI